MRHDDLTLGSAPASHGHRIAAALAAIALLLAFAATAPWAGKPVRELPGFLPAYNNAVLVLHLLTAFLLYAQYRQTGRGAFIVLACGYLFAAPLVVVHMLAFPDAFGSGVLVGDLQTTAWVWLAWHGVFPFFAIGYAWIAANEDGPRVDASPALVRIALPGTLLLSVAMAAAALRAEAWLPSLMSGSDYHAPLASVLLAFAWISYPVALAVLAVRTRLARLIDLWLAVTLVALVIEIALSALMASGRYQLGWYLGRVHGLLGSSFVLAVLLRETIGLHAATLSVMARLRETEERFRHLVESYAQTVWETDGNGAVVRDSPSWRAFTGQTLEQFRGDGWAAVVHPDDRAQVMARWKEAVASRHPIQAEMRMRRADGRYRWMHTVAGPIRAADGSVIRWVGMNIDIHPRKLAEAALRRAQEELEARVAERTRALAEANASLRGEIAQRERAETWRSRLLRELVNAQEHERQRISRELHDHLGQELSALGVRLALLRATAAADARLAEDIARVEEMVRRADDDLDFLVWQLRPRALDDLGLPDALRDHARRWSAHFGLGLDVYAEGLDEARFDPEVETVLYRVAQEALNNVAKHSGAAHAVLTLRVAAGEVVMRVRDDGRGFEGEGTAEKGFGLAGMRERVSFIGGRVDIDSRPGGGTTVTVRVPLSLPAAATAP